MLSAYWERIVNRNASYREDQPGDYELKFETSCPKRMVRQSYSTKPNGRDRDRQLIGFRYAVHDGTGEAWPSVVHLLVIPSWFICAVASVLPVGKAIAMTRSAGLAELTCAQNAAMT